MKKFLFYILIITFLVGLIVPVHFIFALVCPSGETLSPDGKLCVINSASGTANVPANASATGSIKPVPYILLTPLPCKEGTPGCVKDPTTGNFIMTTFDPTVKDSDGNNTALGAYLNMMIRLFIGICAVLAVIMIVMGGVEYITSELISSKEAGRERITHAILGLLLAMGSWLLLNTINPDILKSDLNVPTATVIVTLNDTTPQSCPPGGKCGAYNTGAEWDTIAGDYADLSKSGATVYNSECLTVGQPNCTSTRGLNTSTLDTIHKNCVICTLLITGGTEFWAHGGVTGSTSHGVGNPTVDLGTNAVLDNYIKSGTDQGNNRYLKDNISYLYEDHIIDGKHVTHWHAGP